MIKSSETKTETNEELYNKVDRELQELKDNDDSNDKVEIINKDLDDAFRKFLLNDPDKLAELKQKAKELEQIGNNSGGEGFFLLVDFLNKLETELNNPKIEQGKSQTEQDNYKILDILDKNQENNIKSNIIKGCYNILKTKYTFKKSEDGTLQFKKRDDSSQVWISAGTDGVIEQFEDELKEDIKNKNNLSIDAVNKMWDKWLSNENDENDGNAFKDSIYEELLSNALDENDIEIIEGLIAKYRFKKSGENKLQFRDRNNPNQNWTSIDVDSIKSIEGIGDQNKDKIYQELLDSALDENDAKIIDELTTKYTFKKSEDGNLKFKDRNNPSQNWIFFTIDSVDEIAAGIGDQNKDKIYQELLNSALDENDD